MKSRYTGMPEKSKDKKVLLFSGGLDSYLVHRLFKPDVLLYCSCGHRYEHTELQAINKMPLSITDKLIIDETLALTKWERPDAIIPLRNLLFSSVATRYGDEILIGALKDEGTDKCDEFFQLSSLTFSQCYKQSHWCEGRRIKVWSPVIGLSKAQLIRKAIHEGVTRVDMNTTISCYSSKGRCGVCRNCIHRWKAYILNGMPEEDYVADPRKSKVFLKDWPMYIREGVIFKGIRAAEAGAVLMFMGNKSLKFANKEDKELAYKMLDGLRHKNYGFNDTND